MIYRDPLQVGILSCSLPANSLFWFSKAEDSQNSSPIFLIILVNLYFNSSNVAENNLGFSSTELRRYSIIHVLGSNCMTEAPHFLCTHEAFAFLARNPTFPLDHCQTQKMKDKKWSRIHYYSFFKLQSVCCFCYYLLFVSSKIVKR